MYRYRLGDIFIQSQVPLPHTFLQYNETSFSHLSPKSCPPSLHRSFLLLLVLSKAWIQEVIYSSVEKRVLRVILWGSGDVRIRNRVWLSVKISNLSTFYIHIDGTLKVELDECDSPTQSLRTNVVRGPSFPAVRIAIGYAMGQDQHLHAPQNRTILRRR